MRYARSPHSPNVANARKSATAVGTVRLRTGKTTSKSVGTDRTCHDAGPLSLQQSTEHDGKPCWQSTHTETTQQHILAYLYDAACCQHVNAYLGRSRYLGFLGTLYSTSSYSALVAESFPQRCIACVTRAAQSKAGQHNATVDLESDTSLHRTSLTPQPTSACIKMVPSQTA